MSVGALLLPGYVDGIDVSSVQRIDDADAVYAAGFRFALTKVAEGAAYCDPRAAESLARLRGAGLLCGTYGFGRYSHGGARAQARRTVDGCAAVGAGTEHVVRPVLDLESCPKGTPWAALRDFAEAWIDEARASGALPVLYTMGSWLGPLSAASLGVPVWVAQYRSITQAWAPALTDADSFFGARPDVAIWQYSGDKGHRVPGIAVDCDRNVFRGDEAALRGWFGLPPEGAEVDMGGPVHGSHVVDASLGRGRSED